MAMVSGTFSSWATYERTGRQKVLKTQAFQNRPIGSPLHILMRSRNFFMGASQLRSPLPGPIKKPRYLAVRVMGMLAQRGQEVARVLRVCSVQLELKRGRM